MADSSASVLLISTLCWHTQREAAARACRADASSVTLSSHLILNEVCLSSQEVGLLKSKDADKPMPFHGL